MKHSGLQKSISSIFDSTEPIKQETSAAANKPAVPAAPKPQPAQPTAIPSFVVSSSSVPPPAPDTRLSASNTGPVTTAAPAAKPAARPRPVPKQKIDAGRKFSFAGAWKNMKARLLGGSKKSLEPRQKKAMVLGAILAVVFVGVLLFVLGSGPSSAKAASKKDPANASANTPSGKVENWTKPEIYPLSLRDPMKPSSNTPGAQDDGEMTVRGIVYSEIKPSAIIANQIVFEGDVILGVKIIKIGKDFVAFEKDGKQWQQQVRQ